MILYFLKWAQSLLQPCHNNLLIHYGRCIYSFLKWAQLLRFAKIIDDSAVSVPHVAL